MKPPITETRKDHAEIEFSTAGEDAESGRHVTIAGEVRIDDSLRGNPSGAPGR
jgi:hypothetical protein